MPDLLTRRGTQARLARELGVHRSTICRDAQRMWDEFCGRRKEEKGRFGRARQDF
jgi:hypothetical protein